MNISGLNLASTSANIVGGSAQLQVVTQDVDQVESIVVDAIAVPANQVLESTSLLCQDNSQLCSKNVLTQDENKLRHGKALEFLNKRMNDFERQSILPQMSNPLNIKEQYEQFLNFLLTDLSLYFGIAETNILDIIDGLVEKRVFSGDSGILLKEAVETLCSLRGRLQLDEAYLDGLKGCILTTNEKTQLEKIYWLVLRPLYRACLPAIVKEKKDADVTFDQLDLLTATVEEMMEPSREAKFYKHSIKYLIMHLNKTRQGFERHFAIFKRISTRTHLEDIRRILFDELEMSIEPEERSLLLNHPNPTGARLGFLRKGNELRKMLQDISTTDPHSDSHIPQIKMTSSTGVRYIIPKVIREIFEEGTGDLKRGYPRSAHRVARSLSGLHFKQKPMHPLMEYAIHNLFSRIGGELTPSTELVRFEVNGKMYPVLVSTTIEGNPLSENIESLPPAKWARWTWMLLCSILTRPGDGRPSNYIMDAQRNIFCIDNDVSFVEPVIKYTVSSTIHFFCALFCLFQDKSLDQKVLEEFCSLEIDTILLSWIEDVIKMELEYLKLFSDRERKILFEEDPSNKFMTTILFREGAVATLKMQFAYLQKHLAMVLQNKLAITPVTLLSQLVSLNLQNMAGTLVSRTYQRASQETRASQESITDKLKWISSRTNDKSLTSLQTAEMMLDSIPSFEEVERQQRFSPSNAKEELCGHILYECKDDISFARVKSKGAIVANFINLAKDLERQKLVLISLVTLVELGESKPLSVTLCHCDVLNETALLSFLHEGLESLDISYCPRIVNKDIEEIRKRCPNLTKLYMNGCVGVTAFAHWGILQYDPLEFAKLETLSLASCPNLETVRIKGTSLTEINGRCNPKLGIVILLTPSIQQVNFEHSPNHTIEEFVFPIPQGPWVSSRSIPEVIKKGGIITKKQVFESFYLVNSTLRRHFTISNNKVVELDDMPSWPSLFLFYEITYLTMDQVRTLEWRYKEAGFPDPGAKPLIIAADDPRSSSKEHYVFSFFLQGQIEFLRMIYKYDRAFVLLDVEYHTDAFKDSLDYFKNDEEIVRKAVSKNGMALKDANDRFKVDQEVVSLALKQCGPALEFASDKLKNNRQIVSLAVRGPIRALQESGTTPLQFASDELKDDEEIVKEAVANDWRALNHASDRLKNDMSIILIAIRKSEHAITLVSDDISLKLVKQETNLIAYANREVVLQYIKQNCKAFFLISDDHKDNKEIVLAAVQQDGLLLQHASNKIKNNLEVVLAAVHQNGLSLEYTSNEIKDNKEVVLAAVQQNGLSLKYASNEIKDNQEVVLAAMQQNGDSLGYASGQLRNNEKIVLFAVSHNGKLLKHASANLKNRKEIVLTAVNQNGLSLEFASSELRNDKIVVLTAVRQNKESLLFASDELQNDIDILNECGYNDDAEFFISVVSSLGERVNELLERR